RRTIVTLSSNFRHFGQVGEEETGTSRKESGQEIRAGDSARLRGSSLDPFSDCDLLLDVGAATVLASLFVFESLMSLTAAESLGGSSTSSLSKNSLRYSPLS